MYYSAIGILALLILIIENRDILLNRNDSFKQEEWKVYRCFLFIVLVYYITDILWGYLENRKLSTLLFADTSVYFIAVAAGVLFWTQYVVVYLGEKKGFGRYFLWAGRCVTGLLTILTVVNIFTPILFEVTQGCVYRPLVIRYVVMTAQVLLLLLVSAYALSSIIRHEYSKSEGRKYRTISLFGLVMSAFMIAQMLFPLYPLNAIAYMLGTCLIRAFVIGDEKDDYRMKAEAADRIRELQHSITALLDNMPALSFSKDANTGVYLACNQAFAEYAHKENPDGVRGLTDAQIFDPVTAEHFCDDDRKALSMEEPYIFFEDVPDAAGNQRQFQTTKLKFIDDIGRLCLLGMCQDVTDLVRIQRENAIAKEERIAFTRLNALLGDFLCVYLVNPETGYFREFSSSDGFRNFELPKEGEDFFGTSRELIGKVIFKDDTDRFLTLFTEDSIKKEISEKGIFNLRYRIMIDGRPNYVQLKAALVEEDGESRLVAGIIDIDSHVRQEENYEKRLAQAQRKVYIDGLTGIRNKLAYIEEEKRLDKLISEHSAPEFDIVILDVNNLKKVNDTEGHQAGDQYIRKACRIICNTFKHSPVFRVGGDEFAVVVQGTDHEDIRELVGQISDHNKSANRTGGIVIACGMATYENDESVARVFERADHKMYANKSMLKEQAPQEDR